jgi:cytoskeletal protein RodZ
MPTVAEQLRRAREARGLSVAQMAEITKIKSDHIRALESGNFDVFTAPVYIRGSVRSCANSLKLDVGQVMRSVDAELAQTTRFAAPPSLPAQSGGVLDLLMYQLSKLRWQAILPIVAGLAIIAGGWWGFHLWRTQRTRDPLAALGPGYWKPAPNPSLDTLTPPAPVKNVSVKP